MVEHYEKFVVDEYMKLNYYVLGVEAAIGGLLLSKPDILGGICVLYIKLFWVLLSIAFTVGLFFAWSSITYLERAKALIGMNKQMLSYQFTLNTKLGHLDLNNRPLAEAYIQTLPPHEKQYLMEVYNALTKMRESADKEYKRFNEGEKWTTFGSRKVTNTLKNVFRYSSYLVLFAVILFGILYL